MRTIAYVDGYNLYFGCLKYSPYKWLDIVALVERILHVQNPEFELVRVKYFSAPIRAKLASHGDLAMQSQQKYHRAIEARGRVEIIEGWYSLEEANALEYRQPPDKNKRIPIWRLEEKETDVNIALQMYRDALNGHAEQLVLVTNDSDMVPVLKMLRKDCPNTKIGLIFPIRDVDGNSRSRPVNKSLSDLSNWTRQKIKNGELEQCQLPGRVPTRKKPIDKPDYW